MPSSTMHRGPFSALDLPRYRSFAVAHGFVNAAELMQQFTVGWLAIQIAIRDGHPERGGIYLGAIALGRLVAGVVTGIPGGVLADRLERRDVLRATAALSAVVLLLFGIVLSDPAVGLPTLVVLGAVLAASWTLDAPARLSFAPMLVDSTRSVSAVGVARFVVRAIALVAPLLAGALLGPIGAGGVLALSGLLCALSVVSIAGVGSARTATSVPTGVSAFQSFRDGLGYTAREPTLRAFMAMLACYAALAGSFTFILPAVVHDSLGGGARELSLLAGAWGLGGLFGAATVATMGRWRSPGYVLVANAAFLGLLLIAMGALRDLAPMLGIAGLIGFSSVIFDGGGGTILQLNVPDRLRGRLVGLIYVMYAVGIQIGVLALGAIGSFIGISNALVLAGAAMLIVGLAMARADTIREGSPHRRLETEA